MSNTKNKNYLQKQERVSKHVLLLLGVICISFFSGLYTVYASNSVVYEVSKIEKENSIISREIAKNESAYHTKTQKNDWQDSYQFMVNYSPAGENVRYAQVGGAVYSMIDRNQF